MNKIIVTLLLCCSALLTSAQTTDSTAWRNVFTDPQLRNLIETALEHNADLRTANLNVVQAEAQLKAARLAFLPSLTVGAEGQLSDTKGQPTQKTYNIPVTMQWEVEYLHQYHHHKLHRREVVVVDDHLIPPRLLQIRPLPFPYL